MLSCSDTLSRLHRSNTDTVIFCLKVLTVKRQKAFLKNIFSVVLLFRIQCTGTKRNRIWWNEIFSVVVLLFYIAPAVPDVALSDYFPTLGNLCFLCLDWAGRKWGLHCGTCATDRGRRTAQDWVDGIVFLIYQVMTSLSPFIELRHRCMTTIFNFDSTF